MSQVWSNARGASTSPRIGMVHSLCHGVKFSPLLILFLGKRSVAVPGFGTKTKHSTPALLGPRITRSQFRPHGVLLEALLIPNSLLVLQRPLKPSLEREGQPRDRLPVHHPPR